MACPTNIDNYIKLKQQIGRAVQLIQSKFASEWKAKYCENWQDNKPSASFIQFVDQISKPNRSQKELLKIGDSKEWDVSLLFLIFNTPPLNNSKYFPFIRSIKDCRNKIDHKADMKFDDKIFTDIMEILKPALKGLGMEQVEIDNLSCLHNIESPKKSLEDNNNKAISIKQSANEKFNEEDYNNAKELYSSAIILEGIEDHLLAVLYCNRSLTYLKIHRLQKNGNDRDLCRALNDANQTVLLDPKWHKGYARLGEIYKEFNELELSIDNFGKAYTLSPDNEEYRNSIDSVKQLDSEQRRLDHLQSKLFPMSIEEQYEDKQEDCSIRHSIKKSEFPGLINKTLEYIYELDPPFKDVVKGHEYRDGSATVQINYEMAAKHYAKAMAKGNAEAFFNMGVLTAKGKGVKQNFELAFSYFKQAANQAPKRNIGGIESINVGKAEAEHNIALMYYSGIYVQKNIMEAIMWYEKGVEHGSPPSATNLGLIYAFGEDGVPRDLERGEKLLILGYNNGDTNAMNNLVEFYIRNMDYDKALLWHERALEKNCLTSLQRDEKIRQRLEIVKKSSPIIEAMSKFFTSTEKGSNSNTKKSVDPIRISHFKELRKTINQLKKNELNISRLNATTVKPPKMQKMSAQTNNFKRISFSEIDFTKDHVLNGYILTVSLIDRPCTGFSSVHFLIQDEKEFVQWMSVYNLGQDFDKIHKDFKVGQTYDLYNPYIRLAADGGHRIRIDDPKSMKLVGEISSICRHCGLSGSKFNCSRCMNALYCSKECQTNDWKLADHKLICFK